MLFNSYVFLCVFLPSVLVIFWLLGRSNQRELAMAWLVVASLVFYGWWNPVYLALIVASVAANFTLGRWLETASGRRRSAWA
jgi:D-alanyl-lipoteichoic acid acyltransferase DltB (MBOAT superfamily)